MPRSATGHGGLHNLWRRLGGGAGGVFGARHRSNHYEGDEKRQPSFLHDLHLLRCVPRQDSPVLLPSSRRGPAPASSLLPPCAANSSRKMLDGGTGQRAHPGALPAESRGLGTAVTSCAPKCCGTSTSLGSRHRLRGGDHRGVRRWMLLVVADCRSNAFALRRGHYDADVAGDSPLWPTPRTMR